MARLSSRAAFFASFWLLLSVFACASEPVEGPADAGSHDAESRDAASCGHCEDTEGDVRDCPPKLDVCLQSAGDQRIEIERCYSSYGACLALPALEQATCERSCGNPARADRLECEADCTLASAECFGQLRANESDCYPAQCTSDPCDVTCRDTNSAIEELFCGSADEGCLARCPPG